MIFQLQIGGLDEGSSANAPIHQMRLEQDERLEYLVEIFTAAALLHKCCCFVLAPNFLTRFLLCSSEIP
jgi:hypothetical protein